MDLKNIPEFGVGEQVLQAHADHVTEQRIKNSNFNLWYENRTKLKNKEFTQWLREVAAEDEKRKYEESMTTQTESPARQIPTSSRHVERWADLFY